MQGSPLEKIDKTRINRGQRCVMWAKVGSDMQLCTVEICGEPVRKDIGFGKSDYVEVFGFGIKRSEVNVKKLLVKRVHGNV